MVLRLSLFAAFLLFIACSEPSFDNPMDPNNISHPGNIAYESFTDARDGQTYKSVVIGTQTWMADNLNYDLAGSYCGDKIRNGTNIDTLVSKGGYCDIYGRLYNWNTAMSVCPSGWHLPSKAEWDILLSFASWKELKSKNGWLDDGSNGGGGDDKYGFTALPSGGGSCSFFVGCSSNHFGNTLSFGHYGYWWTATEGIEGYAYYIFTGNSETYGSKRKSDSYSVRCVKDGLCGSQPFNSGTQFCNGNSVYSLCSGKEYDPATQRCGTG
ncbi:MAG: hypothetical protein LBH25_03975, partial [Fibromonadaceae bacterium]|nr:hypothetical protein [Fibromonadaceae bacterium]